MVSAAVRSKVVVLLFLIHSLLVLPLYVGACFVMQYLVSFQVLQQGAEVIKLFFMLNSAEHKFLTAHNVKMPRIVGILTFITMINTTSERLKAINFFICRYFSLYERLKFRTQLS